MDKSSVYSDTLLRAYSSGLLMIIWNTTGFSIGIDPKRKDAVPELREKDFIDYAFSIIKIVVDLAEEKELKGISDCDLETARKIYEQESDLKGDFIKNTCYVVKRDKDTYKILQRFPKIINNSDNSCIKNTVPEVPELDHKEVGGQS